MRRACQPSGAARSGRPGPAGRCKPACPLAAAASSSLLLPAPARRRLGPRAHRAPHRLCCVWGGRHGGQPHLPRGGAPTIKTNSIGPAGAVCFSLSPAPAPTALLAAPAPRGTGGGGLPPQERRDPCLQHRRHAGPHGWALTHYRVVSAACWLAPLPAAVPHESSLVAADSDLFFSFFLPVQAPASLGGRAAR